MTAADEAAALVAAYTAEVEELDDAIPPPPNGCSADAQALWYALLESRPIEADPAAMALAEQIVLTQTLIDQLRADMDGQDLVVRGSMNQPTTHPHVGSINALSSNFRQMLKQLPNPDGPAGQARRRSSIRERLKNGGI